MKVVISSYPSAGPARKAVPSRWWVVVGVAALLLALVVGLRAFDPARTPFFPRCLFHSLTGLHCPGCGGQRAVHALLHGNVAQAFQSNALALALLPAGGWMLARRLVKRPGGGGLPAWCRHHGWPWVLLGAVVVFAVLRNLPSFRWLAP